ncbi:hypothetical protein LINGRAHAP2_LOCUS8900 [Linum grandiflorum]
MVKTGEIDGEDDFLVELAQPAQQYTLFTEEIHWKNLYRALRDLAATIRWLITITGVQNIPKDLDHLLRLIELDSWYDHLIVILGHPCTFGSYEETDVISTLWMRHKTYHMLNVSTNKIPRLSKDSWNSNWKYFMQYKGRNLFQMDQDVLYHLRKIFEHGDIVDVYPLDSWLLTEAKKMHCIFPDFLSLYFQYAKHEKIIGKINEKDSILFPSDAYQYALETEVHEN